MSAYLIILGAVLPVVALVLLGMLSRRLEWIAPEADRSLLKLTINLFVPCLILTTMLENEALRQPRNLLVAPLTGFGTVMLGFGICILFSGRAAGLKDPAKRRTFTCTTGLYNYGYIPIPLALVLFDRDTLGVLFVHNLGVEIAMWSGGLLLLTGSAGREVWRNILNPPLMAILLGAALNLGHLSGFVPEFIMTTMAMLGACAIPVGIILIGATFADFMRSQASEIDVRVMSVACGLRLLLLPLLMVLLARYLPFPIEVKRVIVLQAAMPSAVFPVVLARIYGGDAPTALRIVLATSAASLITMPLWLKIGTAFALQE